LCFRGSQKYNHEWGLQQLTPADEDPFEKQMRLSNESQVRASTVQRYDKSQTLDQLEEWMKEKPIPYISNDNFSQEVIFHY
jgi:hypothetical protein